MRLRRILLLALGVAALAIGCGDSAAGDANADASVDAFGGDGGSDVPVSDAPKDSDGSTDVGPVVETTPKEIPLGSPPMGNPERGEYLWLGVPGVPSDMPILDAYERWLWRDFEPTEGAYDYAKIDAQLAAAAARGGRFGLRIMPMCQGCEDPATGRVLPDYLHDTATFDCTGAAGTQRIPDWNSTTYMTRLEALVHAIADKYGKDPRFGFVDIMGYGNWGEWHVYPYDTSDWCPSDPRLHISDANTRHIVDLHVSLYPERVHLVSLTHPPALSYIKTLSRPIGLRVDCFGALGMMGGIDRMSTEAAFTADAWKKGLFITEWCNGDDDASGSYIAYPDPTTFYDRGLDQLQTYGISMLSSGNFPQRSHDWSTWAPGEQAAFLAVNERAGYRFVLRSVRAPSWAAAGATVTIETRWDNVNVAPPYRPWSVRWQLRDASGKVVAETTSKLDLRTVLPTKGTPVVQSDAWTIPAATPKGKYTLVAIVTDPEGVTKPLALAIEGRAADGSYAVGAMEIR